jgi:hypothetical protein
MRFFVLSFMVAGLSVAGLGQAKASTSSPKKSAKATAASKTLSPSVPAAPATSAVDMGTIDGHTYTNRSLRFEITFPDSWLIAGEDFEAKMLKEGFDLRLRAPVVLPMQTKAQMNRDLKRVNVLVTAYRSNGSKENAIMRVSVEDLSSTPQVKDAVDYFDLMRAQFGAMKLPADFKYSETQAEALGRKQFGFLDISSKGGSKRLYATVRGRQAILFTLTYTDDADLEAMRRVLSEGNFSLR